MEGTTHSNSDNFAKKVSDWLLFIVSFLWLGSAPVRGIRDVCEVRGRDE